MTVQELINVLDALPSDLPVTALIWPESDGGELKHVAVMSVAKGMAPEMVAVLRLANSL